MGGFILEQLGRALCNLRELRLMHRSAEWIWKKGGFVIHQKALRGLTQHRVFTNLRTLCIDGCVDSEVARSDDSKLIFTVEAFPNLQVTLLQSALQAHPRAV